MAQTWSALLVTLLSAKEASMLVKSRNTSDIVGTKRALIRNVSLFQGCSDRDIDAICGLVDTMTVPAGTRLTREGHLGQECFVIATGAATVSINGQVVRHAEAGDVIGEMALVDAAARAATVVTTAETSLLVLDPRSFNALLRTHPSVTRRILAAMAQRLRAADERLIT